MNIPESSGIEGSLLFSRITAVLTGGSGELAPFADPVRAASNLNSIVSKLPKMTIPRIHEWVSVALVSPAPDMALNNLERFVDQLYQAELTDQLDFDDKANVLILVTLFAGSQFLTDVLIRQPEALPWLLSPAVLREPRSQGVYRQEASEILHKSIEADLIRQELSRWRRRHMLRIGVRDLLGLATVEEVSRDVSDLAQAIIEVASHVAYHEVARRFGHPVPEQASWQESPSAQISPGKAGDSPDQVLPTAVGMCILGMGKLGGRELNFSSDIDLVFIYEAEGETTGRLEIERVVAVTSNHQFFTRMGERIVHFLADRGPEGNLFRVDMRLRPDGQDGPLVRSVESFVHYLSSQARDWERLAYLKARVLSGPARVAERLYRVISAFVYAGVQAERLVREVQELKLRIDREVIQSDSYHRELKRGYGGIREIEFVIATLQIIHGYTHEALRVRNAFLAIQRLREVHVLSEEEAGFYQLAYSFLRKVEHRLQMAEEHQTHTLPQDPVALTSLAKRSGYNGTIDFMQDYVLITNGVHERFTRFFKEDLDIQEQEARDVLLLLDREGPDDQAMEALRRRGLDGAETLRVLHSLGFGTREVFISAEGQRSFAQILPSLLRLTSAAPRPERVLPQLNSFVLAIKGITYYYEVLAKHPDILRLLVTLFGTSDYFSGELIAHPEFFDALISSRILHESDYDGTERLGRIEAALKVRSLQRKHIMLRRAARFECLLSALQYLLKLRPLEIVLDQLSSTADACLAHGARIAVARIAEKTAGGALPAPGGPEALQNIVESEYAVLALGKYGGNELNFFGDLDVLLIYDDLSAEPAGPAWSTVSEFYNDFSDQLFAVMSEQMQDGKVFVLDARLRPHGKNSPIATPLSQMIRYMDEEAEIWELLAYQRARLAWGSSTIHEAFTSALLARVSVLDASITRSEVTEMRRRLEHSIPNSSQLEIKRSAGGIVDVEFVIQYLVLSGVIPLAESDNYFHLLRAAPPGPPEWPSADDYHFLRDLENKLRLLLGSGGSTIPADPGLSQALARLMDFPTITLLNSVLLGKMKRIRAVYNAVLQPSFPPGM